MDDQTFEKMQLALNGLQKLYYMRSEGCTPTVEYAVRSRLDYLDAPDRITRTKALDAVLRHAETDITKLNNAECLLSAGICEWFLQRPDSLKEILPAVEKLHNERRLRKNA